MLGGVGIAVLLAAACTGYAFYLRGRAVADRDQALANYVACFRGPPLRAGESLHQRLSANQATPGWPGGCLHYDDELYTAEARVADHDLDTVCIERPSFVVLPAERCLEAVSHYDLGNVSPEPAARVRIPERLLVASDVPVLADGLVAAAPSDASLALQAGDRICRFDEGALDCRPIPPDAQSAFPIPTTGGWPDLLRLEPWQLWVAARDDGELTRHTIGERDWVPFVRRQGSVLVFARSDRVELREGDTLVRQIPAPPGTELVALGEAIVWSTPERAWVTSLPSGPDLETAPLVTLELPDSANRRPSGPFTDTPRHIYWYSCVHEGHVTTAFWEYERVSVWFDDAGPVRGRLAPDWFSAARCEREAFTLVAPQQNGLAQLRCDAQGCVAAETLMPAYWGLSARVAFRGSSLVVVSIGSNAELRLREATFDEIERAPDRVILVPDYGEPTPLRDVDVYVRGDDVFVFFVRGPLGHDARGGLRVARDGSVSALMPR